MTFSFGAEYIVYTIYLPDGGLAFQIKQKFWSSPVYASKDASAQSGWTTR